MSKKKKEWRAEKERLLSLGLEDRRKEYSDNYKALDKIPTWRESNSSSASAGKKEHPETLSDKVSLHKGDITILEVDAIVNAANSSLLGGGGVDGCIHRAAGHFLYDECHSLNGCETGKAKITCGYDLPAKYVIHTVGPIARGNVGHSQREALKSCYNASLQLVKDLNLRSVAFPCISTGIYGFPNEPAAVIALNTVRDWLKDNKDKIDRIIFCVFLENDYGIYQRKMSEVFSPGNEDEHEEVNTDQAEDDSKLSDTEDVNMMSQGETETEKYENDIEMGSQGESNDEMNAETQSQEPENVFPVTVKEEAKAADTEHSVSVQNEEAAGESKNMDVKEEPVEEKGEQEDESGAEKETMDEKTAADIKKEEENEQTKNKESQGLKEGTEPEGTPNKEPNTPPLSSMKDDLDDDTGHEDGTPEEPNLVTNKDSIQPGDGPAEQSEQKE